MTKSLLANVGGTELFKCNYDYNLLDLDNHLPAFLQTNHFFFTGRTSQRPHPKNKNEVLPQPIWNKRFVLVNKKG